MYLKKYPKLAIVPWSLGVIVFLLMPSLTNLVSTMVVVLAVIAMGVAVALARKGRV